VRSPIVQFLGEALEAEKKVKQVNLAQSPVFSKAVNLLFRELVKELHEK
jgi:hypothetical protein